MTHPRLNEDEYWSYPVYRLVQIVPATGFQGVYAIDVDDGLGSYKLESRQLDALAIADVIITHRRFNPATKQSDVIGRDEPYRDVVGLILEESGEFCVVNEDDNFAGLCREGDDVAGVMAYLDQSYFSRPLVT